MTQKINIQRTQNPKTRPDEKNLGFGRYFTDHMFIMDYNVERGWHDPRIVPYGPLSLEPSTMIFHYGQAIFEGLKAYKAVDGRILLFRPDMNMKSINISNDRMSIPPIDEQFAIEAVRALVKTDRTGSRRSPGPRFMSGRL